MTEETEQSPFVKKHIDTLDSITANMDRCLHMVPGNERSIVEGHMYLFMASVICSYVGTLYDRALSGEIHMAGVDAVVEHINNAGLGYELLTPTEAYQREERKIIIDQGHPYCFFLPVPEDFDLADDGQE